jgi:immune inhibitor A
MRNVKALRCLSLFVLIGVLLAGNLSITTADPNPTPVISWADLTPPAHYRHRGDWLVDVGWSKPEDVYGPFPSKAYQQGDSESFYALDFEQSGPPRRLTANLLLVTEHAYWWFEEGADVDQAKLEVAAEHFEKEIYPLDGSLFGSVWNPGIDGDPRIFILHQKQIGGYAVGVFSPRDECPRRICPTSNQHEMIYLGLNYAPVGSQQELSVIAHEFQHLIQYNNDGNEERWLDEGLAQLAEHLNGFNPRYIASSNLREFLRSPNFQLNSWPLRLDIDPSVNYAVGYIWSLYLYQRFGTDFVKHLARSPYKGLASVEESLRSMNTGQTLDQVFTDWTVTNYVNSPYVDDGRYYYQSLKLPQRADPINGEDLSATKTYEGQVHEYGADYLQLQKAGTYTLTFEGDQTVKLTDAQPTSGQWMWWSFNSERGDARLERTFDLTKAENPELTFNAWWDMGRFESWAHVLVSSDGGKKWEVRSGTDTQECRVADRLPCYNGSSDGWQQETVDLSPYAGKTVKVRFDYITDQPGGASGMFIDDIQIPAIGYSDDVESGDGGWTRQGFVRVTSDLPQHWGVNVITRGSSPKVIPLNLDTQNSGRLKFTAPTEGAVVVIAAMAPFVETTSNYSITARSG